MSCDDPLSNFLILAGPTLLSVDCNPTLELTLLSTSASARNTLTRLCSHSFDSNCGPIKIILFKQLCMIWLTIQMVNEYFHSMYCECELLRWHLNPPLSTFTDVNSTTRFGFVLLDFCYNHLLFLLSTRSVINNE